MEHLLGIPPTPPPPGVETNLTAVSLEQPKSVRERLALHRTQSSCNHCHGVIDPLGQALENYNAIGEWRERERDTGVAIDSTGELADGRPVNSPGTVARSFGRRAGEVRADTSRENLLTYALGRAVEYHDMPVVRSIVREAEDANYSFESIVMGVATSVPFRMRTLPDTVGARERRCGDGVATGYEGSRRRPAMFITKKHLSRRTFLRASGVSIGLPLLSAMVPAGTALSQTAAAPKPRLGFFYLPHGAVMDQTRYGKEVNGWTPDIVGKDFDLKKTLEPFAALKQHMTVVSGLGNRRPKARPSTRSSPDVAELRTAAPLHDAERRHLGRPDRRAPHRSGDAAAVPRARDGRTRRVLGLRRHLRLQLRPHDLVSHPDHAAPDGSRPRQGVREDLRARQHGLRPRGHRERLHERSRHGAWGSPAPREGPRRERSARWSTTTSTACASSNAACSY